MADFICTEDEPFDPKKVKTPDVHHPDAGKVPEEEVDRNLADGVVLMKCPHCGKAWPSMTVPG